MPFVFNPFTNNFDSVPNASAGANTNLSNLGTTAINADLIMDQTPLNRITTTAADAYHLIIGPGDATTVGNNLIFNGGYTAVGTGGNVNFNGGASDSGAGGNVNITPGPGTTVDGNVTLQVTNSGTINLIGDVASVEGQPWCATDASGAGYWNTIAKLVVTDLVTDSWGPDLPAIVLNGTTAEAIAVGGVGIIFEGDGDAVFLPIITNDKSNTDSTPGIFMYTGKQLGTGASGAPSGEIAIQTGTTAGDGNATGAFSLLSGAASGAGSNSGGFTIGTGSAGAGGTSGSINLSVGAGTTNGDINLNTSGVTTVNASALNLPVHAADPTVGITLGSVYVNNIANKIKFYNGVTWETVTSI